MPRAKIRNFCERERDALVMATASNEDILKLCRGLGDDPDEVAEHVRQLLLSPVRSEPSAVKPAASPVSALPLKDSGLLPLHRILLVDDEPARLAERLEEFRLHQFSLGFLIETATNGEDALARLQNERFEAVLIELQSPTEETRRIIEKLRNWSTPLAPILLNSAGLEVLELRKLNRNVIRALAQALRKQAPRPYRKKGPGREGSKRPCQSALFDASDPEKTGTT
jgi:CheY-like chemotaxis protein